MCEEYLITFHKEDLINILQDDNTSKHFSIDINFVVLYESHPNLGLDILEKPDESLQQWDNATIKAQLNILKEVDMKCQLKNNVHCRVYQLATCSQSSGASFPGNKDVGKFIQLSGTVMRISGAKLLEFQRSYICVKCKTPTFIKAVYEKKYMIKEPKKCENPEGCSGTNLVHFGELDTDNCKDYQEIKIQESVKQQGVRAIHNTMMVTLEDDLVDSCKPGDNVTICGIVKRRWGEFDKGKKIDIDITLKANYLQVDNKSFRACSTPETLKLFQTFWENYSDNPLLGRDTILKSFCPQIYGLYLVKLAIAVIIAGGSQLEDTTLTGVRTRSESHLLLVGDPGTGKSQMLRFASKIVPRSVLTTGIGSTAAGLTVTAVMERGEWQLEAGALVMSDGGICCIDEFNSMKEHDRTSIHEAMEQQTISVAKASLVCKLNTRCSILAACNPKGNVDPSQPLCMSVALPSPLLSRFDLVLVLRDVVNEEWDSLVADYILNGAGVFSKFAKSSLWTTDTLQSYFVMVKKFHPKLTQDAEVILSSYYQLQRRVNNRNKARTTVRLLESLVRLSQGHARLMYHEKVEVVDSIYAIILVDAAMDTDSIIFNLNLNVNSIFPERPSSDYRRMLEEILKKLQLGEILEKELLRINTRKESNLQSRFFSTGSKKQESIENCALNLKKESEVTRKRKSEVVDQEENSNNSNKLKRTDVANPNTTSKTSLFEQPAKVSKKANSSMNTSNLQEDEGYDTVSISSSNCYNNSHTTLIGNISTKLVGFDKDKIEIENVANCRPSTSKTSINTANTKTSTNGSMMESIMSRPVSSRSIIEPETIRINADEISEINRPSSNKSILHLQPPRNGTSGSEETNIISRPTSSKNLIGSGTPRENITGSKEESIISRPSSSKAELGSGIIRTNTDNSEEESVMNRLFDRPSSSKAIIGSPTPWASIGGSKIESIFNRPSSSKSELGHRTTMTNADYSKEESTINSSSNSKSIIMGSETPRTSIRDSKDESRSGPSKSKSILDLRSPRNSISDSKEANIISRSTSSKNVIGSQTPSININDSKEESIISRNSSSKTPWASIDGSKKGSLISKPPSSHSVIGSRTITTNTDNSKEESIINRPSNSKSIILGSETLGTTAYDSKDKNSSRSSCKKNILDSLTSISSNNSGEEFNNIRKNISSLNPTKNTDTPNKSNDSSRTACKNRFKNFRYTARPRDHDTENKIESNNIVSDDYKQDSDTHKNLKTIVDTSCNNTNKTEFSEKKRNQTKFNKKNSRSNLIKNELDLLKLVPGVNDDFNIDLDFDWDNFENECLSSTMVSDVNSKENCNSLSTAKSNIEISQSNPLKSRIEALKNPQSSSCLLNANKQTNLADLSQNSKSKYIHNTFSFKPKFGKRISSDRSSTATKSDSSIGSAVSLSQHRGIFETDDDVDLDF